MSLKIQLFENQRIRTAWDEEKEEWYFSIVDVVGVLTDSVDPTAYWRKLKQRLKAEGNETVTNCHGLKMTAHDGKKRLTDVADTEQLLRIIQSIQEFCDSFINGSYQISFLRIIFNISLIACLVLFLRTFFKRNCSILDSLRYIFNSFIFILCFFCHTNNLIIPTSR